MDSEKSLVTLGSASDAVLGLVRMNELNAGKFVH
jgi:hypothetical protein